MFRNQASTSTTWLTFVFALLWMVASASYPARAQVSLTFQNPVLSGVSNNPTPLLFRINLSNGASPSSINVVGADFENQSLPSSLIDFSPFTNNTAIPDPLPASYLSNVGFFNVSLQGVPVGTYRGTASISYVTEGNPFMIQQNFALLVTPGNTAAPEPCSLVLLLMASGVAFLRHGRKASRLMLDVN